MVNEPVGGNAMDNPLKLINDQTLCLVDKEGNAIASHKPFWTRFKQFKRIREDCIIIKEDDRGFSTNSDKANIYCLDDKFRLKWTVDAPFENDSFPNEIVWNKKLIWRQGPDGYTTLDTIESADAFICSSWKGITVTVDYDSGQIISSELTK